MVVLTIGLGLVVLALTAVGIRLAGGREPAQEVVEVPSRAIPLPSTTTPSTSAPGTTLPRRADPTAPTLDTTTPTLQLTDPDGRFEITVPRSWVNLPAPDPDTAQLRLFEQTSAGTVQETDFVFVVRWFDSGGCSLATCAAEHVVRLQSGRPSVGIGVVPEVVAGRPGIRLDSSLPDQRLVGWLVVQGDRYWVMELIGPLDGFDEVLPVARQVLATMSFG